MRYDLSYGENIYMAKEKETKFTTKIIYGNNVYLMLSDVAKALNYPTKQLFVDANADIVTGIKGIGNCILETDYNNLLAKKGLIK